MPWQRMVAEVGGEIDPDTGLPAYRDVIVTVPRQSGKTTLVLAWEIQRALGWQGLEINTELGRQILGPQRIAYSAQTGNDARKKLIEDQVPLIERQKRALNVLRILKGMGNEAIEFRNGSRIVLLASSEDSGHGKTIDLAIKDEFFADIDNRRDQALVPAMATKPAAQVITTSTAGTDASVPLNTAVARGRAAVDLGKRSGIAYFEWSADPDADIDDPAVWWGCMPALGFTQTEAVIQSARETLESDDEFRRAFLNIPTKADERVIPASLWDAVCKTDAQPSGQLVFALDVNPERSAAAIVACSRDRVLELVEHRPGIGWIAARAKELQDRWGGSLALDSGGPAGSLIRELEKAKVDLTELGARDLVTACGAFYDDVAEARITIRRHPKLDDAVAGAAKRTVGDAWAWGRRQGTADISPLVAATLAAWVASQEDAVIEPWVFSA